MLAARRVLPAAGRAARRRRRRRLAGRDGRARPRPPCCSPLSGTVPLGTVLPAMLGVHAVIGVGEAVVTVAAVSAVLATRPDLIALGVEPTPARRPAPP